MAAVTPLSELLRHYRRRADPSRVPAHGRRRTAGLRREDVAHLAGVSVGYYARLEQGRDHHPSPQVLTSLARVFGLSEPESDHLHRVAGALRSTRDRTAEPERVRPGVATMLRQMSPLPALVLGRWTDVLAWNDPARELLADPAAPQAWEPPGVNWTREMFLGTHLRSLFADWPGKARDTVFDLRRLTGESPGDHRLAELVDTLAGADAEFRHLWAETGVVRCGSHVRTYRHATGTRTLHDEVMVLPDDDGQRLVVFYPVEPE